MPPDAASLAAVFPLKPARVHEVCGPGATGFAAICAARGAGPVLWVRERWRAEGLNPVGLSGFFDPDRLLIAQADSQAEVLAVAEEALRDGAVPTVVIELRQPLGLTPGRRLQLAAKAGRSTGLCLIGMDMGSNAAETRWHAAPVLVPDGAVLDAPWMRWEVIKNKSGTCGAWQVRWDRAARRLEVMPAG